MKKKLLHVDYYEHHSRIPYYEFVGLRDGPHFVVSGGMHGDEVNGVALVSKFLQWCKDSRIEESITGRLTVIPVLNISGFAHMQRYVYEDGKDLNRYFGVKGVSSFSEYTAQCLLDTIYQHCDYGIDVHDSGDR